MPIDWSSKSSVIDDFVHSRNKRFAGKSKKERIRMALGASYKHKGVEEAYRLKASAYENPKSDKEDQQDYQERNYTYKGKNSKAAVNWGLKKIQKEFPNHRNHSVEIDEAKKTVKVFGVPMSEREYRDKLNGITRDENGKVTHRHGKPVEAKTETNEGVSEYQDKLMDKYEKKGKKKPAKPAKGKDYWSKHSVNEELSTDASELVLHGDNTYHLYRSSHMPIIKNLLRKKAKGVYEHEKAKKLWGYHADRAAQSYTKEHGHPGAKWHERFSPKVRKEAAAHWADRENEAMDRGEYSHTNLKRGVSEAVEKDKTFSHVQHGETFRFSTERDYPFSGMAKGPWVKTGPRSYTHAETGGNFRVGSIKAKVLKENVDEGKKWDAIKDSGKRILKAGLVAGARAATSELSKAALVALENTNEVSLLDELKAPDKNARLFQVGGLVHRSAMRDRLDGYMGRKSKKWMPDRKEWRDQTKKFLSKENVEEEKMLDETHHILTISPMDSGFTGPFKSRKHAEGWLKDHGQKGHDHYIMSKREMDKNIKQYGKPDYIQSPEDVKESLESKMFDDEKSHRKVEFDRLMRKKKAKEHMNPGEKARFQHLARKFHEDVEPETNHALDIVLSAFEEKPFDAAESFSQAIRDRFTSYVMQHAEGESEPEETEVPEEDAETETETETEQKNG